MRGGTHRVKQLLLVIAIIGGLVGQDPAASAITVRVSAEPASDIEVGARLVPRDGRVALTFDDGPHPRWTPVILDLLDELDVRATFYVLGFKLEKYPEIGAEIVRRGHSLQPHAWDHSAFTLLSNDRLRSHLQRSIDLIVEVGGPVPTCVRPPFGATSDRVERVAAEVGLDVIIWDINSRDYAHQSPTWTVRHSVNWTQPGHVILMHDTVGYVLVDSLPTIVRTLRARGMEFDTLCDDRAPRMSPWDKRPTFGPW